MIIAADDAGHGLVDGNDGGGAVTAKMGELDGLEAHGDFLVYSWPEKAFWLNASNALPKVSLELAIFPSMARMPATIELNFSCSDFGGTGIKSALTRISHEAGRRGR